MNVRNELLVQIAELYYQQNMNQAEIAKSFGLSRPSVSRFLEEARKRKIVEIFIHGPVVKNAELSGQVRKKFDLKFCSVVESTLPYRDSLRKCARAAGDFLHSILGNNMTIAISWGTAMGIFAEELERREYHNIHVAQMVGCLGDGDPSQDGIEISRTIAEKLGARYSNIYAPAFVDSVVIRDYFLKETLIATAMRKAMYADISITGVGSMDDPGSVLSVTGYLTPEDWVWLKQQGCVTHLIGRMFNEEGMEVNLENKYVISTPLENLKEVNWSVGIAASADKEASVRGAVKSGYINCLIIDEPLARALLASE